MNNNKGYLYEIQIRDYIINNLGKMAYLWSHTPENILIEHNIIGSHNEARLKRKENKLNGLIDTGIDIIQIDEDKCSLVQCKNGYKKGLTMNDLAGFMCWMAHLDKLNGYVYYTDKLSINIRCLPPNPRIEYIKHNYNQDYNQNDINIDDNGGVLSNFIIDEDKLKYQMEAYETAKEYYQENINGIISMPCGTGKTYVSYLIKKMFRQIIILSPLKQFAKQNLDRYNEYGYKYPTLLVDSDGCRDIETIKEFIENNKRFVISATFDSIDVIYLCMEFMHKPFFIIDEFHNLSKNNVTNEDDIFYKVINTKHRKLFMSATPRVYEMEYETDMFYDVVFGSTIYHMSFTDAIKDKYITDYTIWLPSIHENTELLDKDLSVYDIDDVIKSKCKFLYSCLVNNGSRKCIIYCTDTNEITSMMQAIEILDDYYCLDYHMDYITSDINHKKRDSILKHFASSNKIELLFSCRILDECIDIPSCDSIFITYSSQSKIRTIQRLCRCIRTDSKNKYKKGNIFIWCDEYSKILETLSGIKEYDIEFRDKIKLNVNGHHGIREDKGLVDDKKLIGNYIIGIKLFRNISWDEKLEMVKMYINENNKRPSCKKQLGIWLIHQLKNYKLKLEIMKIDIYYNKWTEFINNDKYKKYFISKEKLWYNNLSKLINYFDIYNKKPLIEDEEIYVNKLCKWMQHQTTNYNKKEGIMKNKIIYNKWNEFINNDKYKQYFLSNEDKWYTNLNDVINYIDTNNKRPASTDKDIKIKQLGYWIGTQVRNYKNKLKIMGNEKIYNTWHNFINKDKYKQYFLSDEEYWYYNLNNVINYIDINKKLPNSEDKEINTKQLGRWIGTQFQNYKNKKEIMQNEIIYNKWNKFINDDIYKLYFLSDEDIWIDKLNKVIDYLKKFNKKPSLEDTNIDFVILARWIYTQISNYKHKKHIMKNIKIYNMWTKFISDYKYKEYFISSKTVWMNTLHQVIQYINTNNKRPSKHNNDYYIDNLGQWVSRQSRNYKNKKGVMKEQEIYDAWTAFINDPLYKKYFE